MFILQSVCALELILSPHLSFLNVCLVSLSICLPLLDHTPCTISHRAGDKTTMLNISRTHLGYRKIKTQVSRPRLTVPCAASLSPVSSSKQTYRTNRHQPESNLVLSLTTPLIHNVFCICGHDGAPWLCSGIFICPANIQGRGCNLCKCQSKVSLSLNSVFFLYLQEIFTWTFRILYMLKCIVS